jgi:hypothetical protein
LPPTLAGLLSNGEAEEGHYVPNAYESYDGEESSYGKNSFKFVCINNNNNTVIEAAEEPLVPPTPPEPPTPASLTVNKQVFGCDNIIIEIDFSGMDCGLENNSTEWLDCNNSSISNTIQCQSLPESIFDIEVLDDQNTQIQEFEGSTEGTTIQNLDPGTYTVNEIIHPFPGIDRLSVNAGIAQECIRLGFDNGGELFNSTSNTVYINCLEYEDEQGNDCNTITLAAGESRTCTVKNYIRVGNDFPPNTVTSAFDINTAGGPASSFSSPPTIAPGTEDDLSALEKTTKLKQQWLSLLP